MLVPDLKNGYMVNTYDGFNRFQTFVECALSRQSSQGPITAYLSNRCRPESISPDSIFNGLHYSFCIIHTTAGTFDVHVGSAECSRNPFRQPAAPLDIKPTSCRSVVHCPEVSAREVSFDEALAWLQEPEERSDRHNNIYMEISWRLNGQEFRLHTPCRYTNFPNPERDHAGIWEAKPGYPKHEHRYLQPISGWVLYHDGSRYYVAYVAVHLTADGTKRIEFCVREPISFFQLRRPASRVATFLSRWLAASWLGRYLTVSEFHRVIPVDGECRLYRYD